MVPEVTPLGEIAPRRLLFVTLNAEAGIPLKLTSEAFVKFFPVIVTIVPVAPFVVTKLVIAAGR